MFEIEHDGPFWRMTMPVVKAVGAVALAPNAAQKPILQIGDATAMDTLVRVRPDSHRMIAGAACVPTPDVQGEWVEPGGLILTYFAKQGRINWHHGKGADNIVGHPVKWTQTRDFWYVWAHLAMGVPQAESAFRLADAGFDPMQPATPDPNQTQLAWSVEGRTLATDPQNDKRITSAIVINLSLTPNPVCPDTFAMRVPAGSDTMIWPQPLAKGLGYAAYGVHTPANAGYVGSDESSLQDVLRTHYMRALNNSCNCMAGSDDGTRFVDGYRGAINHFYTCCRAPIDMARDLAANHDTLARETGRLVDEGDSDS
jgi:hypothetical protein